MSDRAVSPLAGAESSGFAKVSEAGLRGMITLRGDLADAGFAGAVKAVTGCDVPGRREVVEQGGKGVAWMSPDELLVMVPHAEAEAAVAQLSQALAGSHFLAVNVSDARAVFTIEGAGAREVLAKLAPVDLSPEAFGAGQIRRTRLAQVPAAFWLSGEEVFTLVAFRSVAQYVFDLLTVSAKAGSEVGFLAR
ncbi:Sarcosine oxidase, gamma subunit family [Pseudoruegeria aquimaris]|uniref:Sarcosine oxidase, gamma subunit family n=1 Tax=Pseudoruegeria aquimaris TaxID=393663 RepID=A0A1Y5RPV6_9RHOB|nr:sarcosine oxidase subunit gamma family protein [Pseudoruegeria aquimaris]SLN22562.1 Sarcosine oxidase, gamma subunit family [Pseudoruegeria aquimaris]